MAIRNRLRRQRRTSRSPRQRRLAFETFEPRCLLTTTPLTVEILGFLQLEDPEGPLDPSDTGDFYPFIQIADHDPVSFVGSRITSKVIENSPWTFTEHVEFDPDSAVRVRVGMADYDENSQDDIIDIHPDDGVWTVEVYIDPLTGRITDGNINVDTFTYNDGYVLSEGDGDTEHFSEPPPFFASGTYEGGHKGFISFNVNFPYLGGKDVEDTDGDGLFDFWETNGIDIGQDGNGFALDGADPMHKDVFVEVDAMAGLGPQETTLQLVIDAFDQSPVSNPDGTTGIHLHLDYDETDIDRVGWDTDLFADGLSPYGEDANANGNLDAGEDADGDGVLDPGDPDEQGGWQFFRGFKDVWFGASEERDAGNAQRILEAKRLAYRYGVFADYFVVQRRGANNGVTVTTSGMAYNGVDFVVALGRWATPGGTVNQQAGTFMHELGHTLGLGHGGGDSINNKPNYHSVMNYLWQTPKNPYTASWQLDYSREAFLALDESALIESFGIGGHAGHVVFAGPPPGGLVPEQGPVDWNGDGVINGLSDDRVAADINRLSANDPASPGQVLRGFDDWANLRYSVGDDGFRQGSVDLAELPVEMTYEIFLTLTGSPPTADAGGPYEIFEGDALDLNASASFDPDGAGLTYRWDVDGDGDFDDAVGAAPSLTWTQLMALGIVDDDEREVSVEVSDGVHTSTSTAGLTVLNVAPSIADVSLSSETIEEGELVAVTGVFDDPALGIDTFTGTALWSDGVTTALSIDGLAGTFSTERHFPDDDPTGTPSDTFSVEISIADDDAGSDSEVSPTLTVLNAAPSIAGVSLSSATIDEGELVVVAGSFDDPALGIDTFTGTALWSDGAATAVSVDGVAGTFSTERHFPDDDPTGTPSDTLTVEISIADDDTGGDSAVSPTLTVQNVAPAIASIANSAAACGDVGEQEGVTVSLGWDDPGLPDTFTARIEWGDGSDDTYTYAAGVRTLTESHSYEYGGVFQIAVTLVDDDTGRMAAATTAYIAGVGAVDDRLYVIGTDADDQVAGRRPGERSPDWRGLLRSDHRRRRRRRAGGEQRQRHSDHGEHGLRRNLTSPDRPPLLSA